MIGVLAVENLPQAFDEFSQRQQNINTVALFCTSPPHESEERKIKHAWMKLRGLTLEALIELIEGDTSNARGKATPWVLYIPRLTDRKRSFSLGLAT